MIETRSRSYIILSILFLLALAIRLIYLFELSRIPMFDTVLSVMDHYNFDQGALAFSQGDWLARSVNNS